MPPEGMAEGGMGPRGRLSGVVGQHVSRETWESLTRYARHLEHWQKRINLVSPETIGALWHRHITDCAQLAALAPAAMRWVDLGSGAGLPGLVIACLLAGRAGARVDLVESNAKKCAFLRHVIADLALPARVHCGRIEAVVPDLETPDVVTARALAPLTTLIGYANLLLKRGATGLFPKGRSYEEELTEARKTWHFSYRLHPSATDPAARIVEVRRTD